MAAFRTHLAPIVALTLLVALFVFTLLAISTSFWSELRTKANGGECILEHRGLWRQCIRYECDPAAYTCYTTVSDVAGDGKDPDAPELEHWYYAVQAIETLAFIGCIAALALWTIWFIVVFCFGGRLFLKFIKIAVFVLLIFIAIFHFLGVIVWACKDDFNSSRNTGTWKLCWSWFLAIVACIIALVALIFIWFSHDSIRVIRTVQVVEEEDEDRKSRAEDNIYTVEGAEK